MSGIVGILHQDQSPVESRTLKCLTESLGFRGPDGQETWMDGPLGFGHSLLKTTEESEKERQPFSLDGVTWIVADARLDARSDLIALLQDQSRSRLDGAPDVELILRAYHAWGEACVEQLLGDFAFGIWDGMRRRLFCGRDHMGVKPFYYAHLGPLVIFSNTLECIRRHPAVSDRLNDLAIADFLLLQVNQDPASTSFADIQRLPPAHTVTWSGDGKQVSRYWTMPIDAPLFLRRTEDYLERFRELLRAVVGDRLRTNEAGVFMSGGLDSTTLTAGAASVLRKRYPTAHKLSAFTMSDPEDPTERECAGLVADALGIPIRFFDWGDRSIDRSWELSPLPAPEPVVHPWELVATRNYYRQAGLCSRVFLHGEGPDHALRFEWQPYVSHLLAQGRYARVLRDVSVTLACNRRLAFPARDMAAGRKMGETQQSRPSVFPEWVNPNLESRFSLRHRWEVHWQASPAAASPHPIRPEAYASLQVPLWQAMFERHDAGWTGTHVEVRHPLMDLRMLQFLLAVPPLPWCHAKYLLRRAMRGILPKPVLRRGKAGVPGATMIQRVIRSGLPPLEPKPELSAYVDTHRFPKDVSADDWLLGCDLRARSLNNWLKYVERR